MSGEWSIVAANRNWSGSGVTRLECAERKGINIGVFRDPSIVIRLSGAHYRELTMHLFPRCTLLCISALFAFLPSRVGAQESRDVYFSTDYETDHFYYCGRAIGKGEEGFKAILEKVSKLPPDTSVVWGPDYDRCGACGGGEPTAKNSYPDLWEEFNALVRERGLLVSSNYPGPFERTTRTLSAVDPFEFLPPGKVPKDENFILAIDCELGPELNPSDRRFSMNFSGRLFTFRVNETKLDPYDVEVLLAKLAKDSRVLINFRVDAKLNLTTKENNEVRLQQHVSDYLHRRILPQARAGNLKIVVASSESIAQPIERSNALIRWSNFHGPDTTSEEVLYYFGDDFVGIGNQGFEAILTKVSQLKRGSSIQLPKYKFSGRAAFETMESAVLKKRNKELDTLLPFSARKTEFDAVIKKQKLTIAPFTILPSFGPDTVYSWNSGDRYGASFVSFGRIVRFDEKPRPAAMTLAWQDYDASKKYDRDPESTATYTIDEKSVGEGFAGYSAAIDLIAKLPAGSVLHVHSCIRTQGTFTCPIIYENHKHFERTGFEPYFGMFPWLIEVAKKHKLEIEWIPDEAKSCGDCELNR